ncbi:LuxR C-terminal-related transcriptional regulator [Gemmatimonas sp.]|uniref:helix-turn-helix transcriptional regulator n=1 Tax=Gemmatimonas sp. TaxID=1962908 RepID=UPI003340F619
MRTLIDSLLTCRVPFLHFNRDGQVLTRSPEARRVLHDDDSHIVDALSKLARDHSRTAPMLGTPSEFALHLTDGMPVDMTALPLRSSTGDLQFIVVLAEPSTVDDTDANANAVPHAEQWYDDRRLTGRERQIAGLVATGKASPLIAQSLGISVHTVRRHTERVFMKLGVSSRAELARRIGQFNKKSSSRQTKGTKET